MCRRAIDCEADAGGKVAHEIRHVLNIGGFTLTGNGHLIDSVAGYSHVNADSGLWFILYNSMNNINQIRRIKKSFDLFPCDL